MTWKQTAWILARFRLGLHFCIIKWQPRGGNMLIVVFVSLESRSHSAGGHVRCV